MKTLDLKRCVMCGWVGTSEQMASGSTSESKGYDFCPGCGADDFEEVIATGTPIIIETRCGEAKSDWGVSLSGSSHPDKADYLACADATQAHYFAELLLIARGELLAERVLLHLLSATTLLGEESVKIPVRFKDKQFVVSMFAELASEDDAR